MITGLEVCIMLFMVIERFKVQNLKKVYRRFREQGRMTPEGLAFVGSWVEASGTRCFATTCGYSSYGLQIGKT